MKMFNILFCFIIFAFVINSCGDIVDSEPNKHTNIISYNYIKADQEHGVIMPLKVGNVWYYRVTHYDPHGSFMNYYYDSVKVLNETIINNERWFEVYYPLKTKKYPVYMTNTDAGLFLKYTREAHYFTLEAKYPKTGGKFYGGYNDTIRLAGEIADTLFFIKELWKKSENEPLKISSGFYNSIKYTWWFEKSEGFTDGVPYIYNWFVPDSGLVKAEITFSNSKKVFEYINKSDLKSGSFRQLVFDLDFGSLDLGNSNIMETNWLFTNETFEPVTVYSIEFTGANYDEFNVQNFSEPVVIIPNEELKNIRFVFTPHNIGMKYATVVFHTSWGDYHINIHGKCE